MAPPPDRRKRSAPSRSGTGKPVRSGTGKPRAKQPEKPRAKRPEEKADGFGPFSSGRTDQDRHPDDRRRRRRDEETPERPRRPSALRVRGQRAAPGKDGPPRKGKPGRQQAGRRTGAPEKPIRRRRRAGSADVRDEIMRLGGRRGDRLYRRLSEAADAYSRDHERDAIRILKPLREDLPESPSVRELYGLSLYRAGRFPAAAKELAAFVELTGSVEQHPVLMDCYRAQRRWGKVDDLWQELAAVSPSPELVTEGRIVAAGALADRGRIDDAITLLSRRDRPVQRVRDHHLRLWYALGDLEERAGNLPRARALFDRVRKEDAGFADVAERLAALA